MARISLTIIGLVLAVAALNGCKKNQSDCAFIAPKMVYIDFTESETDTMIIRRYQKGTNFSTLLDTFRATKALILREVIGRDSVVLAPANYTKLDGEFYANDWEIVLPGANRTDRFSEVLPRFAKETEASGHCQSFAESMRANGALYEYENWFNGMYKYYINR